MEDLEIGYAIGGSIAASAYGEPRSTNDVDLVLALPAHRIDAFLARFPPPKFDASRAAAWEAVGTPGGMFNVVHFKIDVYPVTGAIEASQVARARPLTDASGRTLLVSPPEELIVKKLSFMRWAAPTSTCATSRPSCSGPTWSSTGSGSMRWWRSTG